MCREAAEANSHRILPELEFADEAVSGTKRRRVGLDAMLRAAEAGEFHALYFHSLSRLARESVITMPTLKRLVHAYKVRIVSLTEGIDSARDGWELIASIMSVLHEQYIKELSANTFRGQEGAVLAGFSVGDYRFGYNSEPIPGSEQGRRGRSPKPRMKYVIDAETAPWVVRIFHWFVHERRSLTWIARELNRRGAPKDHRATTPLWYHEPVTDLLACKKYVGTWPWGEMENKRDPETGQVRQEPRSEEEVEKWTRRSEHLRIVDDETFAKAQKLLDENIEKYAAYRRDNGTLRWRNRGSADSPPRHLLSKLIKCDECGRTFYVGGTGGKYLFCPGYRMGVCTCKTQLRRDRAERMILDEIGQRILANPAWQEAVYESLVNAWREHQQRAPLELAAAQRQLADTDQKIRRILDRIEEGLDDPDVKRRLEQRRAERREVAERIKKLEQAGADIGPEPTEDWLNEQLAQLGERLRGDTPAAAYALCDLVGGQIIVMEIRRDGRQRHFLRGRFTIRSANLASVAAGGSAPAEAEANEEREPVGAEVAEEIVIDFVEPNPLNEEALEAKSLYDEDLLGVEIAEILGCSRSKVTKLLKHAHDLLGEAMPDGRSRRSTLAKKHRQAPMFEQIEDEAMRLYGEDLLIDEIAIQLNCDRATVTKAIQLGHQRRGLPVPDGRTRRKTLDHKVCRAQDPRHSTQLDDRDGHDAA